MTSSIANETVDHSKNREPFSFYKFITNKYFLNVVSIVLFLALWDYVAKEKIFRDSLARPLEVVDQLYRLTYMKFAGTNLIGHIWASTQRVLIGFIAASVVAVPLGLFMALNKSSAASAGMKSSTYASPRRSPQSSPASRSPSAPLGPAFWPPN